jgi:hypothetical protein
MRNLKENRRERLKGRKKQTRKQKIRKRKKII